MSFDHADSIVASLVGAADDCGLVGLADGEVCASVGGHRIRIDRYDMVATGQRDHAHSPTVFAIGYRHRRRLHASMCFRMDIVDSP